MVGRDLGGGHRSGSPWRLRRSASGAFRSRTSARWRHRGLVACRGLRARPPSPVTSTVRQTAVFDPNGLLGLVYWYGIYPLHAVVFRRMLAGIARAARGERAGADDPGNSIPWEDWSHGEGKQVLAGGLRAGGRQRPSGRWRGALYGRAIDAGDGPSGHRSRQEAQDDDSGRDGLSTGGSRPAPVRGRPSEPALGGGSHLRRHLDGLRLRGLRSMRARISMASFITATAGSSTCRFATPSGWPR